MKCKYSMREIDIKLYQACAKGSVKTLERDRNEPRRNKRI